MPPTSKMFAAIDGLLALCRNASTLTGVEIYDGPMVLESEDETGASLFIGATPDDDEQSIAASSEQDFGPYGNGTRDEVITINCLAEAWTGDTDIRVCRERVKDIVAAVEALVRQNVAGSDPSLGGAVQWSRVTGQALRQSQTDQGAQAVMTFLVVARARV